MHLLARYVCLVHGRALLLSVGCFWGRFRRQSRADRGSQPRGDGTEGQVGSSGEEGADSREGRVCNGFHMSSARSWATLHALTRVGEWMTIPFAPVRSRRGGCIRFGCTCRIAQKRCGSRSERSLRLAVHLRAVALGSPIVSEFYYQKAKPMIEESSFRKLFRIL